MILMNFYNFFSTGFGYINLENQLSKFSLITSSIPSNSILPKRLMTKPFLWDYSVRVEDYSDEFSYFFTHRFGIY